MDKEMQHIYRAYYYSAIKKMKIFFKKRKFFICNSMNGLGGYYAY